MSQELMIALGFVFVIAPLLISLYITEKSGWFGIMYVALIGVGIQFLVAAGVKSGRLQGQGFPIATENIGDGAFVTLARVDYGERSYFTVKSARGNVLLVEANQTSPNYKAFTIGGDGRLVEFK